MLDVVLFSSVLRLCPVLAFRFADLGNVDAQRVVGQILSGGGAQRDPEQALRYFLYDIRLQCFCMTCLLTASSRHDSRRQGYLFSGLRGYLFRCRHVVGGTAGGRRTAGTPMRWRRWATCTPTAAASRPATPLRSSGELGRPASRALLSAGTVPCSQADDEVPSSAAVGRGEAQRTSKASATVWKALGCSWHRNLQSVCCQSARKQVLRMHRFRAAAEHNHAGALYGLGYMHLTGHGVPVDHKKAYKHFSSAAELVRAFAVAPMSSSWCAQRPAAGRTSQEARMPWYQSARRRETDGETQAQT